MYSVCGIHVFLRVWSAAWYRLAKYIMMQKWGWSTRGPLVSRCIIDVFCMYLDLASTMCMEMWWYMDLSMHHKYATTCGIRPKCTTDTWYKYMQIHTNTCICMIHLGGVSPPFSGENATIPVGSRLPVWLRGVFIIAVHHAFVLGLGGRHGSIVELS